MNKGILHQYKNCIVDIVQDEDDFNWNIERLYVKDSIFIVLDGLGFEDIQDAIIDAEELINYLSINSDKFEDRERFILVPIDENSNFVRFKNDLEQDKSDFCRHLSWKLKKKNRT